MAGLVLSGLTAFPLHYELGILSYWMGIEDPSSYRTMTGLHRWIAYVYHGLDETYRDFPFIAYGTDWLAFGHLIIALFFWKPLVSPTGQEWVLRIGLLSCALVIPLALIAGEVRGIPVYWRLIDCSFGVVGALPLFYCLRQAKLIALHSTQTGP